MRAGEIVGLAGIMGAGRTELLTALYGAAGPGRWSGVVEIDGEVARLASIRDARGRGPRLRHRRPARQRPHAARQRRPEPGACRFCAGSRRCFSCRNRARRARERSDPRVRRPPGAAGGPVGALSGGNQQKVVLAKEVLGGPRLLLLDEPTRGVDVGAKGEIYARIRELAGQGLGVLIASSEMPELLGLCDRVVVLRARPDRRRISGRRRRARKCWRRPRRSRTTPHE